MNRLTRHRHVILAAALALLSLRALTPDGYMPAAADSGLLFELCPEGMPAEVMQALLAMSRRIQPVMEPLAKTGDADNYMIKWYGQIKVIRRDTHAKLVLT